MKAEFPRKALEQAVRTVGGVVPSRTPKDILKSILITVKDDIAEIFATDSENSIVAYVRGVNCIQPGQVLMPWQRFSDILSASSDDAIQITEDDRSAQINCGRSKFRVQTSNPDDFPPVSSMCPEFGDNYYTIEGPIFAKHLRRAAPFCDTASTKYALSGVCLQDLPEKSAFSIAATDTKKITMATAAYTKTGDPSSNSSVVPRSICDLMGRNIGEDPVDIRISDNDAQFRCGDTTFTCRLVQGRFPRLEGVNLCKSGKTVELVTEPMRQALKQAKVMTSQEKVGILMQFENDELKIDSEQETGNAEIIVPISFSDKTHVRVDCGILMECLKHVEDKTFECLIGEDEDGNYEGVKLTLTDGSKFVIAGLIEKAE